MRCLAWNAILCGSLFLLILAATPSHAQATRTWVSGVGDDANPCSRTAPCKTFAGAISKTAAGGEISVLDPGGFGAVTITKSISIFNDYSGEAGVLASGTNGITVNAAASDIVILRGLVIDGGTPVTPGLNGIRFLAGGALHIEKCVIKNFVGADPNGHGLNFAPSTAAELYVSHSTFINNGSPAAGTGGGIRVQPTGAGSAKVVLNRVQLENNRFGLLADSTLGSGAITVAVNESTSVGNSGFAFSAVTAAGGGPAVGIFIKNTVVAHNNNALIANGASATLRIGNSLITGNSAVVLTQNGGTLTSYKDNQVDGNSNNNTPIAQSPLN